MKYLWKSMIQRCHNPRNPSYANYGGRGITVCDRWRDFDAFVADVGPRPSPRHTLDRIDNDRGYEPGNVRWATRHEQAHNRRNTRLITIGSETRSISEWARTYELKSSTVWSRLRAGWSPVRALSAPANPQFASRKGPPNVHTAYTNENRRVRRDGFQGANV